MYICLCIHVPICHALHGMACMHDDGVGDHNDDREFMTIIIIMLKAETDTYGDASFGYGHEWGCNQSSSCCWKDYPLPISQRVGCSYLYQWQQPWYPDSPTSLWTLIETFQMRVVITTTTTGVCSGRPEFFTHKDGNQFNAQRKLLPLVENALPKLANFFFEIYGNLRDMEIETKHNQPRKSHPLFLANS